MLSDPLVNSIAARLSSAQLKIVSGREDGDGDEEARKGEAEGKMGPHQMDQAATAVIMPAKPKKADLDWRARSIGVGMVGCV